MLLSVQLYSLRNEIGAQGVEPVLKQVRASGFDGVELAGTYGLRAADLREKLDACGLKVTSAHVGYDDLVNDTAACVAAAAALGYKDIIIPGIWTDRIDDPAVIDNLNKIAASMPAGYRLGYHNHVHEFEGRDFFKKLYEQAPAVYLEPDTFWLKVAGLDVIEYCERYADRIAALHMKELSAKGKDDFNPIPGAGVTGCEAVIDLAKRLGHEYIVLEAENLAIPYDEYLKQTAEFARKLF